MPQVGRITLRLLGRFALQVEGPPTEPIRIASKKGCGLLAHLAMHGADGESREALATLLWDQRDRQARQNLRQCLTSLRGDLAAAAPDLLHFEGQTIALNFAELTVDAHEFMQLAGSSAAEDMVRAAELYRGDFLAGFCFEVEPFDEWVRAEHSRIAATAAKVFEFCVAHFDRREEGARAIEAAERLTALDPLREDWQRLLLRAYARYRGVDAALAQAGALLALLTRELGVKPESATTALIAEIRQDVASSAAATACPLRAKDDRAQQSAPAEPGEPDAPFVHEPARPALFNSAPWVARASLAIAALCGVALLGGALWLALRPGMTARSAISSASSHAPTALARNRAALQAKAIVPIFVRPFDAAADDDRKLADALTGDLITDLSRADGLRVISREASYFYRKGAADPAAIGAKLGVNYVVAGSVRTQDRRIHVNVQLVDAATRQQVWGDQFERNGIDRLEVQSEIVNRLARELRVEAMIANVHHGRSKTAPAVAQLVAAARAAHFRGPSKVNLAAAMGYYEKALQRDPTLVPALIGTASELTMGSLNYVFDPKLALARAEKLLQQALAAETRSGDGQLLDGHGRESARPIRPGGQIVPAGDRAQPEFCAGLCPNRHDHDADGPRRRRHAQHRIRHAAEPRRPNHAVLDAVCRRDRNGARPRPGGAGMAQQIGRL